MDHQWKTEQSLDIGNILVNIDRDMLMIEELFQAIEYRITILHWIHT